MIFLKYQEGRDIVKLFSDKIGIHINSLNKKENLSLSDKILFVKWLGNNEEFSIEKRINKRKIILKIFNDQNVDDIADCIIFASERNLSLKSITMIYLRKAYYSIRDLIKWKKNFQQILIKTL